jgi:histidinol-phosphate/aromatic aminotransferase/cobyric acid decarboxylase-like protein
MELEKNHPEAVQELKKKFGNPELPKDVVELADLEKECENDPDLKNLLEDMIEYCERYTETVAKLREVLNKENSREQQEEFAEIDKEQRIIHNAAIDSINVLARALIKSGKNGHWVELLHGSRAAYGKFALSTTYKRLMEMEIEDEKNKD